MNIFLTGGTGFVGTHLLPLLLENNHRVFALARNPKKISLNHPHLKIIKGDLENDFEFNEIDSIDIVIHTAGIVHSYDKEEFFKVNYDGTTNLINKFSHLKDLKFIFISSLASRGPNEFNDENHPVSDYGRSKNKAEEYLKVHAPISWKKIIIRPPMVIGPKDPAVLDIFKMVKDGFILLPGMNSKKKMYSFVCVHDLVETIVKSMQLENSVTLYSNYPHAISFEGLISKIQLVMKKKNVYYLPIPVFIVAIFARVLWILFKIKKHELRLTPDKIFELKANHWVTDSTMTEKLLQQEFKYDLDKTIEITFHDYKKSGWL